MNLGTIMKLSVQSKCIQDLKNTQRTYKTTAKMFVQCGFGCFISMVSYDTRMVGDDDSELKRLVSGMDPYCLVSFPTNYLFHYEAFKNLLD